MSRNPLKIDKFDPNSNRPISPGEKKYKGKSTSNETFLKRLKERRSSQTTNERSTKEDRIAVPESLQEGTEDDAGANFTENKINKFLSDQNESQVSAEPVTETDKEDSNLEKFNKKNRDSLAGFSMKDQEYKTGEKNQEVESNTEKYKQAVAEIDKRIAKLNKELSKTSWYSIWKKGNLRSQIHNLQMSKTNLNREKRKDRNFEEAYAKYKPSAFAMADENQVKRFSPKGEKEYKRDKQQRFDEKIFTRKNNLEDKIRDVQFELKHGEIEKKEENEGLLKQLYKSREHVELKTPLGRLNARLERANHLPLTKRYTQGLVEKLKMATSSWEGAKLVGKEFSQSALYTTGLVALGIGVGFLTRSAAIASGFGVFTPVVAGMGGLAAGAAKQIYKDWGKDLTKVEYAKRVAAAAAYGAVFATAGSLALPYLLEGASDLMHKFTGGSSVHGVGNPVTPEDIKNVTKGIPLYGPESVDTPTQTSPHYKVLNPEKVVNVDVPDDEVLKVVPGIEVTEPEPIKASLEKVNLNVEDVPSVAETIVENNPDVISGLITIEGNENLWNIISENFGGEQVAANAIHDHGKEFANYIMGKLNEQGIEISDKLQNSFEKILTDQNITGKERFWYRLPDGLELDINEIKEIMNKK